MISGGYEGSVRLWDIATGKELHKFDTRGGVRDCVISPNGRHVISGSAGIHRGLIEIWDVKSRKRVRQFQSRADVWTVDISPDGKAVASGGHDGRVELRNLTTGKVRHIGSHSALVSSVKFMPDARSLIAGSRDGKIRRWDLTREKILNEMTASAAIGNLSISPDGKYCLSAGGGLQLWDLRSATMIDQVKGIPIGYVSVDPQWHFALVCSANTVQLWKLPPLAKQSPSNSASTPQKQESTAHPAD